MIRLRNIQAGYDGKIQLRGATFDIPDKGLIGIIGPNGGGKTTLLRVILGLLKPMDGTIEYLRDGIKVSSLRMGYLPQQTSIDRHFPISASQAVGLGSLCLPSSAPCPSPHEAMEMTGVSDLANRPIKALSGGELQRVLLARALVSAKDALVLDEPATYVDKPFETLLHQLIIWESKRKAVVMVSHDSLFISQNASLIISVSENVSIGRSVKYI